MKLWTPIPKSVHGCPGDDECVCGAALGTGQAQAASGCRCDAFTPTTYFDYVRWHGLRGGQIRFDYAINEQSASFLLDQVEAAIDGGQKKLVLVFTSPGGEITATLGLYDRLRYLQRECGVKLEGRVCGYAASAAVVVLQAMASRTAYPNSRFLVHESVGGIEGSHTEITEYTKEMKVLQDAMMGILTSRLTIPIEKFKRQARGRRQWWCRADEAKGMGLLDEVINLPLVGL